jgi:hypothetical protein
VNAAGPFETERQAAELPEVRAIYDLMGSTRSGGATHRAARCPADPGHVSHKLPGGRCPVMADRQRPRM